MGGGRLGRSGLVVRLGASPKRSKSSPGSAIHRFRALWDLVRGPCCSPFRMEGRVGDILPTGKESSAPRIVFQGQADLPPAGSAGAPASLSCKQGLPTNE